MYDSKDPRVDMAPRSDRPAATAYADPEIINFHDIEPRVSLDGVRTWYARGQNFILAYSEAQGDCRLPRSDQADEYTVIYLDGGGDVEITAGSETQAAGPNSLAFVPPGGSEVRLTRGGRVIRMFTTASTDLLALCSNAQSYETAHPNVAPFKPWPAPKGGYRLRFYDMNVPLQEGRFGRIWRGSNFMVNLLAAKEGPRDIARMSPHSHDDFEQCSFASTGEFVHHLRWPWTTNLNMWKDDVHELMNSPSMIVIPPLSIHTTQATGHGINRLIDIFCPPRVDFSSKPGWVLNEDDYPVDL
mgnify:CR=1 FL=1